MRPTGSIRSFCSGPAGKKPAPSKTPVGGTASSSGGRGPISWLSLAIFAGAGTGFLYYYATEKEKQMQGEKIPSVRRTAQPHTLTDNARGDAPTFCWSCINRWAV